MTLDLWEEIRIVPRALMIGVVSILLGGSVLADEASGKPEKLLSLMTLLPADDEIPGWKRSEKLLRASTEEELYRIFNGGASLFTQHGFRSFVGQSYKGPKGRELEVHIFDQGTPQTADGLYENPYAKPSRLKEVADLGEKARIDMTPLFATGVDFIQKGFFVRVVVQDKTDDGQNTALSFSRFISRRIKEAKE